MYQWLQSTLSWKNVDPNGLTYRTVWEKSKREKGSFTSEGTNWVFSFDGHDKLMDFQNSTFPIVIYGCLDTKSRKPVWIEVWDGNSSPYLIACWYFDYLYESKLLTYYMLELTREQRHTMHAYSRRQQCDIDTDYEVCETVIYRPYSCNQASIRRFYISFKQTLKQKTLHDLFFCTGPINSALTVFLFIKISKK